MEASSIAAGEHVWSVDQVKAGVEQLAALHASTWGADRSPCPDIIKGSWNRTVNAIKKHFATKNSLIHGDLHTGNTYLNRTGNPRFLDWQTFHIGSPFHDLSYFIVGALSVEDRRAQEMPIIDHYLRVLTRFGGPSLSTKDEDVTKEYSKAAMAGMGWILTPCALQKKECVFPTETDQINKDINKVLKDVEMISNAVQSLSKTLLADIVTLRGDELQQPIDGVNALYTDIGQIVNNVLALPATLSAADRAIKVQDAQSRLDSRLTDCANDVPNWPEGQNTINIAELVLNAEQPNIPISFASNAGYRVAVMH
ncbi:aminoglycoside phosphotransferase [Fusarium acutatum]|uniref:Aminoglycoside phosphotransferase n=1 Tax=Fusarium acutatum TaxID=78861 RepID=A0A8H4JCQ5_9HYPO|nr:aminoglycoside phosphotransferase [Fusarium acutatum]